MSNFSITIYKLSQQCRYDKAKGNEWDKTINNINGYKSQCNGS